MKINYSQRATEDGKQKFIVPGDCFVPRFHEVSLIHREIAKKFVLKYHYSKTMPAARRCFGLFRQGKLVGVAVFSHPVNNHTLINAFGGKAEESIELGRFCLLDRVEFNAESWFIGVCRRRLKEEGFRGIVAFSDDLPRTDFLGETVFKGHLGTIYAASSAIYTGRGKSRTIRLLPDGTVLSERAISKIRNFEQGVEYSARILMKYGAADMPIDNPGRKNWLDFWLGKLTRSMRHPGNHKYLLPLQKGLNLPKGINYPKIRIGDSQLALVK